jgi:hypothetical protein
MSKADARQFVRAHGPGSLRIAGLLRALSAPLFLIMLPSQALADEMAVQPAPVVTDFAATQPAPVGTDANAAQPLPNDRSKAEAEIRELQSMKQDMQQRMGAFDARIQALETTLGVPHSPPSVQVAAQQTPPLNPESQTEWGKYEPGKGFILVRAPQGELGAGVFAYARYLNQKSLDKSYVDSFGREKNLQDIRSDLQFQKLSLNFKGWLFDPNFRYYFFLWTSNPQMGEGAQVVLGGYFQYRFSDLITVTAGVMPLPSTRSTNYTFPNWLRNDNRVMADEFFRASYSTGIDAQGELAKGLRYRVALANNLAQLGVSSQELDAKFNTVSAALWWMPTTGEFGPAAGMGDFENHQKLATLFGAHYTRSREDAQGQPEVDDFENSQIRLSDGTLLFSPDPFNTGGVIEKATYQMVALNAGMKYRGFHLEGEYYFRWVNDFKTIGTIPVSKLFDHGFSLQGSAMIIPQVLQAYVTGSKIFGEYGKPWELALGANIYPFDRKETRFNLQALLLNHSPVGGSSLPSQVGGDGWVFNADWIVNF